MKADVEHGRVDREIRRVPSLADRWVAVDRHSSGFDYLRVGLAVSVLLWHSYCFSSNQNALIGQVWSGPLGYVLRMILPMFFALSGFLVSGSLERNPSLRTFITLRLIRIYPALCVEVLVSALVIGPIVTLSPLRAYFTDRHFYSYLLNSIGWVHFRLPGVFVDNANTNAGIVNVSLWTVPYELECYIGLCILVAAGFLRSRGLAVVMFLAVTALVYAYQSSAHIPAIGDGTVNGRILILCFLAGCLVFRLRTAIPYSAPLAAVALVAGAIAQHNEFAVYLAPIAVAYATVYLGMTNPRRTVVVSSGDYSYGTYLYAAPIQQTVVWALGPANTTLINIAIALPVTILFALFSWHVVEKPFLKVKRFVLSPPPR